MNFASYQSRGQLEAPYQHYTKPANLQVDNSGQKMLARANAETANVIVEGFNKWREQYDQGKVMEANNEYNRLMSEGTAELMQKKQENALNVVEDYDKLHVKALEQVRKKYGQFINYGKAGQAFTIYTERDNNTRREHMMKYQMAETDAYHETQFNNQLATCIQTAADGGYSDMSIDQGMNRAESFIEARYGQYGKEMVEQQKRLFKGQIVADALSLSMKMEDYSRMGQLAVKYSDYLDPKTRVSVLSMLGKRQKDAHDFRQANDLWAQLGGENATLDDYRDYFKNLYANGGNVMTRFSHYDSRLGMTMPNGRNGCVEAFMRLTAPFFSFSEQNKGEVNVGRVCELAKNSSSASIERYRGGVIPEGCGIIYFSEGDDISDFANAEHITMADGSGGFYGNSSSAKDYEDENGNYVRGDGCIVHSDEQEIGGYQIGYIIRMDQQTMQEMSDLEVEEQAQKAWSLHQKRVTEIKAADNAIISRANDEMQDLMNKGVEDVDQYQAIVNKYAYSNGGVNDHIRIQLEKTVAAIERRNERAAQQEAKRQASNKIDADMQDYIEQKIATGASKAEIIEWLAGQGVTDVTQLNKVSKWIDQYKNNTGVFKLPLSSIRQSIDDYQFAKNADKAVLGNKIDRIAKYEYKLWLNEHDGKVPDDIETIVPEIVERVKKSYTNMYISGDRYYPSEWLPYWENVQASEADLIASGYYPSFMKSNEAEPGADEVFELIRLDGTGKDLKTAEEIRAMRGAAGNVKR